MGIQGTGSCCCIFFRRQSCIEFSELLSPVYLVFIKSIGKSTPANILGKDFLFFRSRISSVKLQFFQNMDCIHISSEFCFRSPFAKMIICDVKINCRNIWDFLCLNRSFEPANNLQDFGMFPPSNLFIVLKNGILPVLTLHKVQAAW